ncbi:MAG: hypothetical protein P8K78_08925 [Pirellulales bacterium]|nr:hypothetical protein [Pirellulales bacterium]
MQFNSLRKDRVATAAHRQKLTIGDTLVTDLVRQGDEVATDSDDPDFWQFIHALNSSDWITAAYYLHGGQSKTLQRARTRRDSLLHSMTQRNLDPLYRAADRFHQDRSEWQDQLQQAYQFGKLPAYGPRVVDGKTAAVPYASRSDVAVHGRNLTRLIPVFQEYEKINQLYQKPGRTRTGAAIRFTQGHNWSFGHLLTDLLDEKDVPQQRRVLVNWDAHRDLSSPFGHLAGEMSLLMQWMQIDHDRLLWLIRHAKTPQELAEVTSMISIAGWILPLLYSRRLARGNRSEIVLVVPREAMDTSNEGYWPDYGTHSVEVGQTRFDHQQIDRLHQLIDQHESHHAAPYSGDQSDTDARFSVRQQLDAHQKNARLKSLQSFSFKSNLGTLHDAISEIVHEPHHVTVHIVDPDHPDSIQRHLAGAHIYLSVDVDFAGTTQLGGSYSTSNPSPHYPLNSTPQEESRHLQLIERFQDFYNRNAENIGGVSVANSPDYTAAEERRRPAAKIFDILTVGASGEQPSWLLGESNRLTPPQLQTHPARPLLISLAGILGISVTGALFWHYSRCSRIKNHRTDTDADSLGG